MSVPNKTCFFSSKGRILLVCAFALCSAALLINYQLPSATYAAASVKTEQTPAVSVSPAQAEATRTKSRDKLAGTPSMWPVQGELTSGFGLRNSPFGGGSESHEGIDIAVNSGVPVVATADGQISQSGPSGGYGNIVQIDHGNGISTIYGHNSEVAVSVGQRVKKGQIISYAGSTGRSTGPHVHYEIRENGNAVDPWKYLIFQKHLLIALK